MLGLILGGLGSAATAAGMTGLGAGLTAAGTAMGGGLPGLGGAPGIGGVGPGAAPPSSMPFGFDISKMLESAASNLGTGGGDQKQQDPLAQMMAQSAQSAQPQPSAPRPPVDISKLMAAIQSRGSLGT